MPVTEEAMFKSLTGQKWIALPRDRVEFRDAKPAHTLDRARDEATHRISQPSGMILEFPEDLSVISSGQAAQGICGNVGADEADRAISHQHVHSSSAVGRGQRDVRRSVIPNAGAVFIAIPSRLAINGIADRGHVENPAVTHHGKVGRTVNGLLSNGPAPRLAGNPFLLISGSIRQCGRDFPDHDRIGRTVGHVTKIDFAVGEQDSATAGNSPA